jgi:ferredoxin
MKGAKKWVAPSLYQAVVDGDRCTGCEVCLDRCFFDALSIKDGIAVVDEEKCLGCGLCAVVCPAEALILKEARPADFIPA